MTIRDMMRWWQPSLYFVDDFGCLWLQNKDGFWWFNGFTDGSCSMWTPEDGSSFLSPILDWRSLKGKLPILWSCEDARAEATMQLFLDEYLKERAKQ